MIVYKVERIEDGTFIYFKGEDAISDIAFNLMNEEEVELKVTAVQMTQEEYDATPEFNG